MGTKNLDAILSKIVEGTAPETFTVEHLKTIGFKASGDRAMVPLMKDLGFLSPDGKPTEEYHNYRDRSRSRQVLGDALRSAYGDVFLINESPSTEDRKAVEGLFKSTHNSSDKVAQLQAATFFGLLKNADLEGGEPPEDADEDPAEDGSTDPDPGRREALSTLSTELHYTIQIHLPPSKEIEVYNAIFKSLRENLLS